MKILRQTVTQIKYLVEMLDHRVGLLEEKCQGFKQEVQGNGHPPEKKARMEEGGSDDDDEGGDPKEPDQEPMVDEDDDDGDDSDWNLDPFNDLVEVKEETIDD